MEHSQSLNNANVPSVDNRRSRDQLSVQLSGKDKAHLSKADKLEQVACQYEQENSELSTLLKDQYKDIKAKVVHDFVKGMVKKNQYVKFNNLDAIVDQDEL